MLRTKEEKDHPDVHVKQITKYLCRKDEIQLHLVQTYIMHIRLYVLK